MTEGVIIRRARILLINGKQAEIKCHQRWKRKFAVGLDGGQDVMETGHGCDTTSGVVGGGGGVVIMIIICRNSSSKCRRSTCPRPWTTRLIIEP